MIKLILLSLILVALSGCENAHFSYTTEFKGTDLDCAYNAYGLSCNWEKHNADRAEEFIQ